MSDPFTHLGTLQFKVLQTNSQVRNRMKPISHSCHTLHATERKSSTWSYTPNLVLFPQKLGRGNNSHRAVRNHTRFYTRYILHRTPTECRSWGRKISPCTLACSISPCCLGLDASREQKPVKDQFKDGPFHGDSIGHHSA